MAVTVLYGDSVQELGQAQSGDGSLWLSPADLGALGWELKPEGMCREEVCISVPADRAGEMLRRGRGGTWVDFASFARYIEQPLAHDEEHSVWCFGEAPSGGGDLLALEAPDFALPGYDGRTYTLSGFRGRKVFLLLWSSW